MILEIKDVIFKEYDIRVVYPENLTDGEVELVGKAFGTFLRHKGEQKAIVGMDNRKCYTSTPPCASLFHPLKGKTVP